MDENKEFVETEFLDERKRADARAPFHDFGYR